MNLVVLIGNISMDPEYRKTQTGKDMLTLNVAVSRKYKNPQGKYDADFFKVMCFGKTAEYVARNAAKGMRVCVSGNIQTGSYTGRDGVKRYTTTIMADSVDLVRPTQYDSRVQEEPGYEPAVQDVQGDGFPEVDVELPFM